MSEEKGLLMTVHGKRTDQDTVAALSLKEARLLAYALLSEAETQVQE